jgi:hypothetical protein
VSTLKTAMTGESAPTPAEASASAADMVGDDETWWCAFVDVCVCVCVCATNGYMCVSVCGYVRVCVVWACILSLSLSLSVLSLSLSLSLCFLSLSLSLSMFVYFSGWSLCNHLKQCW